MRELSPKGPLDIARIVNEEAEALDDMLTDAIIDTDQLDSASLRDLILDLDRQHPLMGQEVKVYGMQLSIGMDEDGGVMPVTFAPDLSNGGAAEGIYQGFAICSVYIPKVDEDVDVVCHRIKTGETTYLDQFQHQITKEFLTYVCVFGSEVIPKLPVNAHSLEDLYKDRLLAEVDKLVWQDDTLDPCTVKTIGRIANRVLAAEEYREEINYQRVSYLNQLGLFQDMIVTTRDIAIATRDDFISGKNIAFSDPNTDPVELQPYMLDILPGYMRVGDSGILLGGPLELFAHYPAGEDKIIFIPMKLVEEIKQVEK